LMTHAVPSNTLQ